MTGRRRGSSTSGLTLVEVLVALLVLAVGAFAVVGLQATGLRTTGVAKDLQELNATAQSELDVWKAAALLSPDPLNRTCTMFATNCTVAIVPCEVSGGDLACSSVTIANFDAHLVEVTVARDDRQLTLRTVVVAP